jgi:hypothetical protein
MIALACECAAAQTRSPGMSRQSDEIRFQNPPMLLPMSVAQISRELGRPYQPGKNRFMIFLDVQTDVGFDLDTAFPAMAKQAPTTQPFAEGIADMLRSPENVVSILRRGSPSPDFFYQRYYRAFLAAPTVEQLEQLARAFVDTCNAGWPELRPKVLEAELARTEDRSKKLRADLDQKQAESVKTGQVLQDTGQITKEVRDQLRGKLLLLDVDIAGAKARLEAAQKACQKPNQHLVDMLATAQIDLAGLLASRGKLAEMLKVSDRLDELGQQIERIRSALNAENREATDLNRSLSNAAEPLGISGRLWIARIELPDKQLSSQPARKADDAKVNTPPGDHPDVKPEAKEAIAETRYGENLAKGIEAYEQKDFRGALGYLKLAQAFKNIPEVQEWIRKTEEALKTAGLG